jgi:mxaJ protein
MCSGCRGAGLAALAAGLLIATEAGAGASVVRATSVLRVCADPNNLPFSNRAGQGFENALARLVARDLHRTVHYTWWPQRRGFIRNTLRAGTCDVVMGLPSSFELAQPTRPYYRSAYVFVSRRSEQLRLVSLDDPRLRHLRIGLHVIGDDYNNVPPAEALASRGIVGNITGYTIYGDYSTPNPPRALIDAVARGDIDVAIAWGPLAGFFARQQSTPLDLVPVSPQVDVPFLPMVFDIAMGVRRGDTALRAALDQVIVHRRREIRTLLTRYGVPLVESSPTLNPARAARP